MSKQLILFGLAGMLASPVLIGIGYALAILSHRHRSDRRRIAQRILRETGFKPELWPAKAMLFVVIGAMIGLLGCLSWLAIAFGVR